MSIGLLGISSDMFIGSVVVMGIGISTILLGRKAFSPEGLPFTEEKRIKGKPAKIIGLICIALGIVFTIGSAIGLIMSFVEDL